MREIEVKLKVNDLQVVVDKLAALGCKLSEPVYQHDFIYTKKDDFKIWEGSKAGQVAMRIRRENGVATFNLKQQRNNELDNLEIETKVDDPEAIDQILDVLGYAPQVEVNKTRRKAKFKDYEICLDEVEHLGSYVELEKMADDEADADKIQEELFLALESLGLSRADQTGSGYDTQIYNLMHKKDD